MPVISQLIIYLRRDGMCVKTFISRSKSATINLTAVLRSCPLKRPRLPFLFIRPFYPNSTVLLIKLENFFQFFVLILHFSAKGRAVDNVIGSEYVRREEYERLKNEFESFKREVNDRLKYLEKLNSSSSSMIGKKM